MTKYFLLLVLPFLLVSCRFYEVDPGKLYRSPQPSAEDIEKYVNENGIKTGINLRGENKGEVWYDQEKAAVDRTGEASAIYQMLYMGKSKKEALEMLGAQFGHLILVNGCFLVGTNNLIVLFFFALT